MGGGGGYAIVSVSTSMHVWRVVVRWSGTSHNRALSPIIGYFFYYGKGVVFTIIIMEWGVFTIGICVYICMFISSSVSHALARP